MAYFEATAFPGGSGVPRRAPLLPFEIRNSLNGYLTNKWFTFEHE